MFDADGMLPGVDDMIDDLTGPDAVFNLREKERTGTSHFFGVSVHNGQIGANRHSEISFVDDEQIGLGNARTAFARDFVAARDIDNVDRVVSEFAAEMGG